MDESQLFMGMPPVEGIKILGSLVASKRVSANGKALKIGFFDVSRAFFVEAAEREIYIELPEEDKVPGEDLVDVLTKTMYGTQDAAAIFQRGY